MMRKMKKKISLVVIFAMLLALLSACGAPPNTASGAPNPGNSGTVTDPGTVESEPAPSEGASDYDTNDFYATLEAYTAETGKTIESFDEAPELAELVANGALPPVEERISKEPMVMVPLNEVGTYGGRIRTAATSPVTGSAETWTMRTQPLFIVGADLQSVVPNVAKGWKFNDDYTELTVYLREGMKWSDGTDFNADAFEFWYNAIFLNDEILPVKPPAFMSGTELMGFTRVSDYEIKYTFAEPNPAILSVLALANRSYLSSVVFAPGHYLKQFHIDYNPQANELAKENGYESWSQYFLYIYPDEIQARMDTGVPGIDPWILERVDDLGNKYFERNAYYWKVDTEGNQLPYIDGQDRLLMDAETIRLKLPAGELDVGLQFTNVDDFELYVQNEEQGDYRTELWVDGRGSVLCNFRFNLNLKDEKKNEIFNNLNFREGLSLAIDREAINDVIWKGLAVTRAATVAPSVSFYEDWMGEYMAQYDVEAAKAKLDECGLVWEEGNEFRTYPDGSVFELNVEYSTFEGNVTAALEMIQQYWQAVGIKTNLKVIDTALQQENRLSGELEFWVWNVDGGSEFGFYADPLLYTPEALEWDKYLKSGGTEGQEPSPEYAEYWEKTQQFRSYPMGDSEYTRLGGELLTIQGESMWNIGIAGLTPKPMVIKNGLKNTPYEGVYDYDYRYWMVFHPEQWYWES